MGAVLSWVGGYDAAAATGENSAALSSEPSRVLEFQSSNRWQLHFNEAKKIPKLMVVDFSATWCGPCKMLEPVIIAMAAKYTDVEFVKIDVDQLSDVAKEFGVQAMPTLVILKQGKEVHRIVGAKKDELERTVEKHRERPKFAA